MVSPIEKYQQSLTPEELRELRAKGGRVTKMDSPKMALASRLRSLKKKHPKRWKNSDTDFLAECLENPLTNIAYMEQVLDSSRDKMNTRDYIDLKTKLHKLHHGEKKQIDMNVTGGNVTLNFGVDLKPLIPIDEALEAEFVEEEKED